MDRERPIIGITMGDAAGIGPEIVAKIVQEPRLRAAARLLVIGDAKVMEEAISLVGVTWQVRPIQSVAEARFEEGSLDLLDVPVLRGHEVRRGQVDARCGDGGRRLREMCLSTRARRGYSRHDLGPVEQRGDAPCRIPLRWPDRDSGRGVRRQAVLDDVRFGQHSPAVRHEPRATKGSQRQNHARQRLRRRQAGLRCAEDPG